MNVNHQFNVKMSGSEIDQITVDHLRNKLVNAVKEYKSSMDTKYFDIVDPIMCNLIINTYSEDLTRRILARTTSRPHTMMDIVLGFNDAQTTVYRRVVELIKNDFLIQVDCGRKENGRKTERYMSTFKTVHFDVVENGTVTVMVEFSNIFRKIELAKISSF